MSLTGFDDEREVFCDMEVKGRIEREGGKCEVRRGNGLGGALTELWLGPASGDGTYWAATPSWERTEDIVRDAAGGNKERRRGEGGETNPLD